MVEQEDCDVSLVCKFFQKPNVLIVIRVQIAVTARAAHTLQSIDDNEFGGADEKLDKAEAARRK